MKQKKFGTHGPDVSVIGQGTWYLDRGDRKAAIAALEATVHEQKGQIGILLGRVREPTS